MGGSGPLRDSVTESFSYEPQNIRAESIIKGKGLRTGPFWQEADLTGLIYWDWQPSVPPGKRQLNVGETKHPNKEAVLTVSTPSKSSYCTFNFLYTTWKVLHFNC